MHGLRIAVRERPDFRIGRAVEQKSVERHAPVGFLWLQRDEVSAGGREGEGDLLGERGLAGTFELDGDLGRLLQRIQLEVINDVCGQGGRGSFVRGEAYGEFLYAWFFNDHGNEQSSAGFLDRGRTDAAAVADRDFRRFGVGGLQMEERHRGRLGLSVRCAGEAIAVQGHRPFAFFGFELQEGGRVGQRIECPQSDPLRLARAFDFTGCIVRLAGDLAGQRGGLAGRHRHQRFGGPFAFVGETEEREDAFVAVEFRGNLAATLDELGSEAAGAGRFQSDFVGRQGQTEEDGNQTQQEGHEGSFSEPLLRDHPFNRPLNARPIDGLAGRA